MLFNLKRSLTPVLLKLYIVICFKKDIRKKTLQSAELTRQRQRQNFYMDLLKLLLRFVKVVLCISCPLPKKQAEVWPSFKACWSFCFKLKVSNESKFSMPLVRCALGNVWRPILRPYFFETAVEILWHKILSKYYMWIVHISLEMVTARTFKSNRFHFLSWNTWTTKFFWDQNFWDQYQDFFETKSFENNTETFLRPKFSRPIPRLFLRPKFSRPIPRLFLRPNIFKTDTDTFFWD